MPAPSSARAKVGALLVGAAAVSTLTGCPRPGTKYGGPPVPPPQAQQETAEAESVDDPPAEQEPDAEVDPAGADN